MLNFITVSSIRQADGRSAADKRSVVDREMPESVRKLPRAGNKERIG